MARYYIRQVNVASQTDRLDEDGNPQVYKVSQAQDGHWECSCKAWIFQRAHLLDGRRADEWETPNGVCKHAWWVIQNEGRMATAVAAGGTHRIESEGLFVDIADGQIIGFLAHLGAPPQVPTVARDVFHPRRR